MKNIFIVLGILTWLSICGLFLYKMGSQNLPNIQYKQDNVDISFDYSIDWDIKTEGDTSSSKNIKYIQLTNKLNKSSINLTLYYKADSNKSDCEIYKDCGFQIDENIYSFNSKEFEQLKTNKSIMISSLAGTEIIWTSDMLAILSGAQPIPDNYYYIYELDNGKLNQAIKLNSEKQLYIEISYMIIGKDKNEDFRQIKKTLEQIINSATVSKD